MKEDLSPYFQGKFPSFLFQDKRWLTSITACIAGVVVLIVYFQSGPQRKHFMAAEEAVMKWESSPDEASYQAMRAALKKVPTLQKKYEAVIAQKLFEGGQVAEALAMARNTFAQVQEDVPFHAAYGATSLLIEQKAFQDALERSVALKEQMLQAQDWNQTDPLAAGSLLYAHNLLRIAFLQQVLENLPGERAAWEEFETFLQEKENLASLVFGNFHEKKVDLTQYITERKKQLHQ